MSRIREGPSIEGITLVIPCRDEAPVIGQVVREWWDLRPPGSNLELLVIDDASADGSDRILADLQREIPFRVVRNSLPTGYGGSLQVGMRHTRTPFVAFTDGDGQYDPRDLPALLDLLAQGYDMAVGVREHRADPFFRIVVSHGFRLLLSVFFVLRARDPTTAIRAGRTEVVRWISAQTRYMKGAFLNEFMVRLDRTGFTYAEAPVRHRPRQSGTSKNVPKRLLLKVSVMQLIALLRLWREFHGPRAPELSPRGAPVDGR